MPRKLINIRLDADLWREARSEAVKQGETMQDWLTEAIVLKLKSDGVEVDQHTRTSQED